MDWMREVLKCCGQQAILRTAAGEAEALVFLQPLAERKEGLPGAVTSIGWVDQRLWLYLGRERVDPGDTVRWNGLSFYVRSSRPYYIGGTLCHWWASLEAAKEAS